MINIAYGPVPSRRLGRSLGINNIPPKICSYACAYCQLGKTIKMQIERQEFYSSRDILHSAQRIIENIHSDENINYLAFVPDGEPTLDIKLGRHIEMLKRLNIPIAVISNGSLIDKLSVRRELALTDWVSLKVDTVNAKIWQRIDRPHGKLKLPAILDGMLVFRKEFKGKLVTETMLINGMNDTESTVLETAHFLGKLNPDIAYLSIPTRPPAEKYVHPANEKAVNSAFQIFSDILPKVELITGYEGNAFSSTGNVRRDILNITSVHPMRQDAIDDILNRTKTDWKIIEKMLETGEIIRSQYAGQVFYMKSFSFPKADKSESPETL